jgi:formyltetrahydrofolate deformylase
MADHILTFTCPDKPGIVYAVTGVLAHYNLTVLDLQQFSDRTSKKFFMRVHFGHVDDTSHLIQPLNSLNLSMEYEIRPRAQKPRVLIMVSKIGHCLNDLYRHPRHRQQPP